MFEFSRNFKYELISVSMPIRPLKQTFLFACCQPIKTRLFASGDSQAETGCRIIETPSLPPKLTDQILRTVRKTGNNGDGYMSALQGIQALLAQESRNNGGFAVLYIPSFKELSPFSLPFAHIKWEALEGRTPVLQIAVGEKGREIRVYKKADLPQDMFYRQQES